MGLILALDERARIYLHVLSRGWVNFFSRIYFKINFDVAQ